MKNEILEILEISLNQIDIHPIYLYINRSPHLHLRIKPTLIAESKKSYRVLMAKNNDEQRLDASCGLCMRPLKGPFCCQKGEIICKGCVFDSLLDKKNEIQRKLKSHSRRAKNKPAAAPAQHQTQKKKEEKAELRRSAKKLYDVIMFISQRDKLKVSDKVCLDCDTPDHKEKERIKEDPESAEIGQRNLKRTVSNEEEDIKDAFREIKKPMRCSSSDFLHASSGVGKNTADPVSSTPSNLLGLNLQEESFMDDYGENDADFDIIKLSSYLVGKYSSWLPH